MGKSASANTKRRVLLVWLLVAFFYFYLSYDYIRATMNDKEFVDYLQHVVQIAVNERRPANEVQTLLVIKAEQLGLPLRSDQITVSVGENSLNIAVNYRVDIDIPLIRREIYTKRFEHNVTYQRPK